MPVQRLERRRPRQARAKDKVDRILAAARALLAAEGAPAFNTNRLAAEAGVGVGSIYEYFPNKEAIVQRLIEDLSVEETDAILARFAELHDAPPGDAIRGVIATVFDLYRANTGLYRVLWALSDQPRTVGHRPGEQHIQREMHARLGPLVAGDLDLTIFTVFHLVESLSEQFAAQDRWPADRCVDEITKAVLLYLGL